MLIRLTLLSTYRAQGPYILRALVPGGVLLGLRSLSIDLISANGGKQEENGVVSKADARKQSRQFDGNYIMSISKGAPNLEELELRGPSYDTLVSSFPFVHSLFKDVIYGLLFFFFSNAGFHLRLFIPVPKATIPHSLWRYRHRTLLRTVR
jgi:hypothetical protein